MNPRLAELLSDSPLIASVQASPHSPLARPEHLIPMAQASANEGVRLLRLEGADAIRKISSAVHLPVIGLIKQTYPGSEVYITPTRDEVNQLVELGCEIIAIDGTQRTRPGGEHLADLIRTIHAAGRLAMADCDTLDSARAAVAAGADCVGTTLAGYTDESPQQSGPDLEFLRQAVQTLTVPVIAEGRYSELWQVSAARRIGAAAVVIGGALNDPVKQTRQFLAAASGADQPVLAIDIGGTWMRGGLFAPDGSLVEAERIPLPVARSERTDWIRMLAEAWGARRIGISSGGTIDPRTGTVTEAKPIIPDHVGTCFPQELEPFEVTAINDGHATAWGHACHPAFAGRRVATLALGTGVGFGLVDRGRIWMGPRGEYARLNDLPLPHGHFAEELLGGAALTAEPDESQQAAARGVANHLVEVVRNLYYPDDLVLAGGVGLAPWLGLDLVPSPFSTDAGLYGAAALALYPRPW